MVSERERDIVEEGRYLGWLMRYLGWLMRYLEGLRRYLGASEAVF